VHQEAAQAGPSPTAEPAKPLHSWVSRPHLYPHQCLPGCLHGCAHCWYFPARGAAMSRVAASPISRSWTSRFGERLGCGPATRATTPPGRCGTAWWTSGPGRPSPACGSASDVPRAGIRFARDTALLAAVGPRAGATRSPAPRSSRGGLVLDLSPLRAADVAPEQGTVNSSAAVLCSAIWTARAARYGLAVPAGPRLSHTGIGGLTLGGGIGLAVHQPGADLRTTCLEVEIVTGGG